MVADGKWQACAAKRPTPEPSPVHAMCRPLDRASPNRSDWFWFRVRRLRGPVRGGILSSGIEGRLVDVAVASLVGELHHGEGDQRITVAEFQQAVRLVNDHIEHDHRRAMPTDG